MEPLFPSDAYDQRVVDSLKGFFSIEMTPSEFLTAAVECLEKFELSMSVVFGIESAFMTVFDLEMKNGNEPQLTPQETRERDVIEAGLKRQVLYVLDLFRTHTRISPAVLKTMMSELLRLLQSELGRWPTPRWGTACGCGSACR